MQRECMGERRERFMACCTAATAPSPPRTTRVSGSRRGCRGGLGSERGGGRKDRNRTKHGEEYPSDASVGPTPAEARASPAPGPKAKHSGSRGKLEGVIVSVTPASKTERAAQMDIEWGVRWGAWLRGALVAVSGSGWGQTSFGNQSRPRGVRTVEPLTTAPQAADGPLIQGDADAEDAGAECRKLGSLAMYQQNITSEEAGGSPGEARKLGCGDAKNAEVRPDETDAGLVVAVAESVVASSMRCLGDGMGARWEGWSVGEGGAGEGGTQQKARAEQETSVAHCTQVVGR